MKETVKKDFYSINEVAEKLSVHPNTIRNFIKRGTITAKKVGLQWRIPIEELDKDLSLCEELEV